VAVFEGRWRELCHQYKFEGCTSLVRPMVAALAGAFQAEGWEPPAAVLHVPVAAQTLRRRGYDQTAGLARGLARRWGIAWKDGVLTKAQGVRRQSDLKRGERFDNVKDAFRASLPGGWRGKGLLLVDDIMTTGATVNACAGALLREGAASVDVLVLARSL
jgi:ComF family protein